MGAAAPPERCSVACAEATYTRGTRKQPACRASRTKSISERWRGWAKAASSLAHGRRSCGRGARPARAGEHHLPRLNQAKSPIRLRTIGSQPLANDRKMLGAQSRKEMMLD